MKHILKTSQITKEDLKVIFKWANTFHDDKLYDAPLRGKILASVFQEPSTRTRLSFETAMLRLGGQCINCENSSMQKGESLSDTIKVVSQYADLLVFRSGNNGDEDIVVQSSDVPVINAGTGDIEHPTQAIIDLYTILKLKGSLDGLNILVAGDIAYARTIKSLLKLLGNFANNIEVVSICDVISEDIWHCYLREADVIYVTRIQAERHRQPIGFGAHNSRDLQQSIGKKELKIIPKKSIIMHPLPKLGEIKECVDNDPRAAYFKQAKYGVFVRMAVIYLLLNKI